MKILAFAVLMILGFALNANAQSDGNGWERDDARQLRQRTRIAEGVASGDLTRAETRQLRAQQRNIRRTERRAEADGVVTRREQRTINRKQNRANRNIRRQKNDADRRGRRLR